MARAFDISFINYAISPHRVIYTNLGEDEFYRIKNDSLFHHIQVLRDYDTNPLSPNYYQEPSKRKSTRRRK